MDNKKLMQILLRDTGDLEQMVGEIRQAGSFDPLDMELLQSRISGIKHLLELACDLKETLPETVDSHEKTVLWPFSRPDAKTGSLPGLQADVPKKNKEKKKEIVTPVAGNLTLPVQPVTSPDLPVTEVIAQNEPPAPSRASATEEQHVNGSEKHILAEKFVAGKSLNDILLEKSKTDPKFSSLPLNSLVNGIGTNERFLFTRELFNGNMDDFNETVHKLDTLHTIQEAIDFLSENFKWGKSETSLRFIELIKRRFIR